MSIKHKHHYIYKTTCNVTNRFYIGMHSTSNLEDGYIGSGKRLWLSINKHGKENHSVEILERFENRESLKLREKELVNEDLLKDPQCMNLMIGGDGGFAHSEERKPEIMRGMREGLQRNLKDPEYRATYLKRMSEWQKKSYEDPNRPRIMPDWTGKNHTNKTKEKIGKANSIKQQGEGNSQFGTIWIHNLELKENKKISKDNLDNYSNWIKGRKMKF